MTTESKHDRAVRVAEARVIKMARALTREWERHGTAGGALYAHVRGVGLAIQDLERAVQRRAVERRKR